MGPSEINGLPAHILLVHLVVVAVPLAALLTVLSVLWPAARRRLGFITPLVALGALAVVPVATHAGEWLEARVTPSPLIERHVHLGHELLPWAAGLFVVAVGQWVWFRRQDATGQPADGGGSTGSSGITATATRSGIATTTVVAVLALALSVGSVIQVYRIGDSGSKAVWTGSFSPNPR